MGRCAVSEPVRRDLGQLLRLAWPVVLSRLGVMTMGLTDAVVVGRYSAEQLGFHALGWAPTSVVVTMCIGLLIGAQILTAQAIGEGRRHDAGMILRRGLTYSLWVGVVSLGVLCALGPLFLHNIGLEPALAEGASHVLLIFALSMPGYGLSVTAGFWLEGLGRPGPAAAAMWGANLVNLLLVLLLVPGVFGLPALGAVGAAWGTFGARYFLAAAILVYILRMPEARDLGVFDKPPPDRAAEAALRRIGFGAGASNFFEVAAFSSMSIIAGWIGGIAVAAWAIVLNVAAIVFMVPLGMASAGAVLVGRAYGAGDTAGVNRAGAILFAVTAVFGVVVALVLWPLAGPIVRGYTTEPTAIAMAVPAVALACLFYLPDALQVVAAQALRSRGDIWLPTAAHLTSYILVMMPLAWFLAIPLGLGVNGIVWAVIAASVVSMAFLLGRFWVLSRR